MMGPLRSASSMPRVLRFGPFFFSPRFFAADTPSSNSAHSHSPLKGPLLKQSMCSFMHSAGMDDYVAPAKIVHAAGGL